ncbi:MAG TPA: hypothetical protein VFM38_11615 [Candidatus Limnocylindrales bacterium]|nr:hypothetical protein [Candidatus Limnocylindrales bacterium]
MDGLQLDEDAAELLGTFQFDGTVLGRGRTIGTLQDGVSALGDRPPPASAHRQVVADAVEPGAGIVRDAPGGDFGRQPQECILHQVLGLAGITHDAGEVAEERRPARLIGGDDDLIGRLLGFHGSPHVEASGVPAMGRRSV